MLCFHYTGCACHPQSGTVYDSMACSCLSSECQLCSPRSGNESACMCMTPNCALCLVTLSGSSLYEGPVPLRAHCDKRPCVVIRKGNPGGVSYKDLATFGHDRACMCMAPGAKQKSRHKCGIKRPLSLDSEEDTDREVFEDEALSACRVATTPSEGIKLSA